MRLIAQNSHRLFCELRDRPSLNGVLLSSEDVTADLPELVEEGASRLMLSEQLPESAESVQARVKPVSRGEPLVDKIEIEYALRDNGPTFTQFFNSGRWERCAQHKTAQLREEGTIAEDQAVYALLVALQASDAIPIELPDLLPPPIVESTLDECGATSLANGELTPDRPLLVSSRLEQEAIQQCEQSGLLETGAAVVGRYVRLPEPLPGASTRIVTIFSTLLSDPRHLGSATEFRFDPQALAEAQQLCDLRGLGESILTVFHTHGWGCGDCNQKSGCALAEANPSVQDYQLLETLLPAKSTLLPIAGRQLGAEGRRPVLRVHAWRNGKMRPIRWRKYQD